MDIINYHERTLPQTHETQQGRFSGELLSQVHSPKQQREQKITKRKPGAVAKLEALVEEDLGELKLDNSVVAPYFTFDSMQQDRGMQRIQKRIQIQTQN